MTRRRRHSPSVFEGLKDYLVPIIGGVLVILLIWSFIGWGDDNNPSSGTGTHKTSAQIDFLTDTTEAFVKYENEKREQITADASLSPGQTLIVKEGRVYLSPQDNNIIRLNKIAELEYVGDNNYSLYSSDAWIETKNASTLKMRYANLEIAPESIVSLTQNEAASTIYVLRGSAKVSNLAGNKTSLGKGQKISISRQDTSKESIELSSIKKDIDSYFLGSDWFLDNNGQKVLSMEDSVNTEESGSGETLTNIKVEEISGDTSSQYIRFENLSDEAQTNQSSLNIRWNIISEQVVGISIENTTGDVKDDGSFTVNNIPLKKKINDLVVKIYGGEKQILEKKVFTVYTSKPQASEENNTNSASSDSSVQTSQNEQKTNFSADGSKFSFTSPATWGKYTTTSGEITIRWKTTADNISKVTVNGFTLNSFNGSTWRYHAFERFGTISNGTNQYKVNYYNKNGKLVYTDYFTIIKKDSLGTNIPQNTSTQEKTPKTNSSEKIPEETLF